MTHPLRFVLAATDTPRIPMFRDTAYRLVIAVVVTLWAAASAAESFTFDPKDLADKDRTQWLPSQPVMQLWLKWYNPQRL